MFCSGSHLISVVSGDNALLSNVIMFYFQMLYVFDSSCLDSWITFSLRILSLLNQSVVSWESLSNKDRLGESRCQNIKISHGIETPHPTQTACIIYYWHSLPCNSFISLPLHQVLSDQRGFHKTL